MFTASADIPALAAVVVALVAAITDVRTRRIPNALTFGASVVAVLWYLQHDGLSGAGLAAFGWAVGLAIFLPLFLLRGMGGGDIKLMAALGAWVGATTILWVAMASAIAGGVAAVIVALSHGYLRRAVSNVGHLVGTWVVGGVRPLPELTLERGAGPRLAYAVPIFVGTLTMLWGRL